ncbi:hypothetical protein F5Y14DRAFT_455602 [Nemania sp. NC0429]|nr:hypothetical protein F5Y14DRAFT_455602 [Nemania sp. NC0429]
MAVLKQPQETHPKLYFTRILRLICWISYFALLYARPTQLDGPGSSPWIPFYLFHPRSPICFSLLLLGELIEDAKSKNHEKKTLLGWLATVTNRIQT